jgi:hypothetical protein
MNTAQEASDPPGFGLLSGVRCLNDPLPGHAVGDGLAGGGPISGGPGKS